MTRISGVVLAGGRGRRLGSDKATVLLGGEQLILRPLRVLQQLSTNVLIAHGGEEQRRALEALHLRARLVADSGEGPLGGLLSTFRVAGGKWVLVAPCDAPFVSRELYVELLARAQGAEGSVPRLQRRENPVIAVYRRDVFLRAAQGVVEEGNQSMMELLPRLRLSYLEEETLREMPYGLSCILDVDSPEDLERAEAVLRSLP